VLGVWLHGATGRRRWARGARWATTWASVRGVRGEVCYTLLGTNPSPRASRPPPPGKRWCHSPAVAGGQGATRASTRPCVRSSASTRPLAATATAAAAAATAFATATATAARARGDRYEREAAAGTTETTGDGYADRGGFGASTEQRGQAILGSTPSAQDELRGCRRSGLRRRRVRRAAEVRGQQERGRDGAERPQVTHKNRRVRLGSDLARRPATERRCVQVSELSPDHFQNLRLRRFPLSFRGNFHHGAISSRGKVSGHC